MNKAAHWIEARFDAFMLALIALAIPVLEYKFCGVAGLAVGLWYALAVGEAVPPRVIGFLNRQPAWRVFLAMALVAAAVAVATGESAETIADKATFLIFVLGLLEGGKRFSRRRRQGQLRVAP